MTFSIIARCARTGQFGIALASHSMAIGRYCDGAVRSNVGATMTQGQPSGRNAYFGIGLLVEGRTATQTLRELIANDPQSATRQIAVVDREGTVALHAGKEARPWAGHHAGQGYAAFGDSLAGPRVLEAVVASFESCPDEGLDERLLTALEAARDAGGIVHGGKRLAERSAALTVWGNRTYNEIDLRVDLHDAAIQELRRVYIDYRPSIAYYEARARSPRNAIPAMEFADMLKKQKEPK
jgi:uncharacterized Ntn-hydrolase superfamily protein